MTPQSGNVAQFERHGFGMIRTVEIKNFRGFERFRVDGFSPINVIIGDNAVGKTALLESIWLTMSGGSDKAVALRQWRGLGIKFKIGSGDSMFDGMFADIFGDNTGKEPAIVELWGAGFENRKLTVSKTRGDVVVNVEPAKDGSDQVSLAIESKTMIAPIEFEWRNEVGQTFKAKVKFTSAGQIEFEGTGEDVPSTHMYAAQVAVDPTEAGAAYTALERNREQDNFRRVFFNTFDWITDVKSDAESGALLADVPWAKQLLPLGALSGGTARAAAALLAMTRNGVVLIDEVESGIFYTRQKHLCAALVGLARAYDTQILMTTHSREWLGNFIDAIGDSHNDITFWRLERLENKPVMKRFSAPDFIAGFEAGEMR